MDHKADAGFTLLETLVALIVFAMVAGAAQLCLSGGWRNVNTVDREKAALDIARAELASFGHDAPLAEGNSETDIESGYTVARDIRPYEAPGAARANPTGPPAFWVRVSVTWQDGPRAPTRSVTLETLKIGSGG